MIFLILFGRLTLKLSVESCTSQQWCSGKISLVGTLAWRYSHIPFRYRWGGGGCARNMVIYLG